MATLDELVIKLSLDPTKFNQGTKEGQNLLRTFQVEAKKSADAVERDAGKMADSFARVTKELLGLGLAIAGANGLKGLVVGTVQAANALDLQSRALDFNAEAMNRWVNTARRAGSSTGEAYGAVNRLVTAAGGVLTRTTTPQAAGLQQMQALGISNPQWNNPDALMRQIVEGFQRFQEAQPGQRAALAGGIPGGDVLLNIANQFKTQGELTKALNESITATHEQAEAARQLTSKFTDLQLAIERGINRLIPEAAPTVGNAIDVLKDTVNNDRSHLKDTPRTESGNAAWNWLVRTVIDPDKQNKWLTDDALPPRGVLPTADPRKFLLEGRNLPAEGSGKISDRFPGLGPAAFASSTYQGWPGAGTHPVDMSRTIRIDQVTLMVPPGTRDPQTFADRFTTAVSAIEAQQGPR